MKHYQDLGRARINVLDGVVQLAIMRDSNNHADVQLAIHYDGKETSIKVGVAVNREDLENVRNLCDNALHLIKGGK